MIYRGSIIEVRENMLIVMLEDSSFQKVKKFNGLKEGMEIYFEERDIIKERNLSFRRISMVAAALFLLIATSFYGIDLWDTNYKAVALVSVDINPSIELKVNRMNHIINAVALNEDAKNLPLLELKNKPLDKGLEALVGMARAEGYIKETKENYILIASVKLKDNVEDTEVEEVITKAMEKIELSSKDTGEKIEITSISSNKETLKEAHREKISVGKKEAEKRMEKTIKEEDKRDKEREKEQEKRQKEIEKNIEKELKGEIKKNQELEKAQERQKKETEKEIKRNEKQIEKQLKEEEKKKKEQKKEQEKWEKELKNRDIKKEEKNSDKENKGHEKENKQKEKNKKN